MAVGCLGACAAVDVASHVPCYDGWNVDPSGASRLWVPGLEDAGRLERVLKGRGRLACVHEMPSGRLIALSLKGDDILTTDLARSKTGEFVVTEVGFVAGNWPRKR